MKCEQTLHFVVCLGHCAFSFFKREREEKKKTVKRWWYWNQLWLRFSLVEKCLFEQNQQTKELISAWKLSHKVTNINYRLACVMIDHSLPCTKGTSSDGHFEQFLSLNTHDSLELVVVVWNWLKRCQCCAAVLFFNFILAANSGRGRDLRPGTGESTPASCSFVGLSESYSPATPQPQIDSRYSLVSFHNMKYIDHFELCQQSFRLVRCIFAIFVFNCILKNIEQVDTNLVCFEMCHYS